MYNIEYHVLSNSNIETILICGFFTTLVLWPIFSYLGQRDASSTDTKKSMFRKLTPWLIFCIFLSDISLLIYRCIDYPWGIDPQPSQASAYRELNEMVAGYPIWGWANDYQLQLLSSLTGTILCFCWTVYAFNFKPSNTSWWKKICKVIAYIILSSVIYAFQLHRYEELLAYAILLVIAIVLLWLAHVTPNKQNASVENVEESKEFIHEKTIEKDSLSHEDPLRFMPKGSPVEDIVPAKESVQMQSEDTVEKESLDKERPNILTEHIDNKESLMEDFSLKESFKKHALTYIVLRPETYFLCKDEKMDTLWAYKDGDLFCDEEHGSPMGAGAFMWFMQKYKDKEAFCFVLDLLNKECVDLWPQGINKSTDELIADIKQYFPDFKLGNDPETVKTSLQWTWIDIQSLLAFFRYCTLYSYSVLQSVEVVANLRKCSSIVQLTRLYLSDFNFTGAVIKEDKEKKTGLSEENIKEDSVLTVAFPKSPDINSLNNEVIEKKTIEDETLQKLEPNMMYCKYCGKKIEADSTFCKYCGKRL